MTILAATTELRRTAFEWASLPTGWARPLGLLALGGVLAMTIWLYRRERRTGTPSWLRGALAGVRCLAWVGLATLGLEPVLATYVTRSVSGHVAVLVDASASMSVRDPAIGAVATQPSRTPTRWDQVRHWLAADDARWLRRLAERNEVSLYAFGDETVRLPLPWGQAAGPAPSAAPASSRPTRAWPDPAAPRTDLGQALTFVLDDLGDSPIGGVVLLSDGGVNGGLPLDEVAVLAQRFKAPLYTVGVGGPQEPPNVRIIGLSAPAVVPPGDPFTVRADVVATGLARADVEVELVVRRADWAVTSSGGDGPAAAPVEQRVAARHVSVGDGPTPATASFEVTPPPPGEYVYQVRAKLLALAPGGGNAPWAAPSEEQAYAGDRARETIVVVLEERLRVLLVAGGPSYEYQFVTRLFERDRSIDVSCWLQSADERAVRDGTTVIRELPRQPVDLFAYDAILLLDPDPAELDGSWAVTVRRWVDEVGGGLLLQAGPHFTTRFLRDPRLQELVAILPVTPDPDADVRLSAQGTYRTSAAPVQIPEEAAGHPLLALGPDPAISRSVWGALPGVWWYLPVLRAKPVATTLLEHAGVAQRNQYGPAALWVVQPFGAGRTGFLGFDGTWRWRATAEPQFNHFWIQLVRYLAQARRQQVSRHGSLTLDRDSFTVGDYVKVEAHLLDDAYAPWHQSVVRATLAWEPGGATEDVILTAVTGRDGWFEGRLLLDREGWAVLRIPWLSQEVTSDGAGRVPSAAGAPGREALTRRIHVEQPDVELRSLRMREDLLTALAEQTRGEYCRLSEAAGLPDRIRRASERKPPQRIAAEPLWDRGWVMGTLAGLLAIEWVMRRRNHLL